MNARRHVDDLFTAAHDDELSPIDDARFHAHLRECQDCTAAYTEFTATVDALREMPRARMPHVVHLPSTPPVAERAHRPPIGLSWFNLGLLRRFPATAIAGGVAVVLIVVALAHGGASPSLNSIDKTAGNAAHAPVAVPAEDAACTQLTPITASSPPAEYSQAFATSAIHSGVSLVIAASSLSVTPGQTVTVYAQLALPRAVAGVPGSVPPPQVVTLRPCVSLVGSSGEKIVAVTSSGDGSVVPGAQPGAEGGFGSNTGSGALLAFTIPAGTPAGTTLHLVAEVPASALGETGAPLRATITLTTR